MNTSSPGSGVVQKVVEPFGRESIDLTGTVYYHWSPIHGLIDKFGLIVDMNAHGKTVEKGFVSYRFRCLLKDLGYVPMVQGDHCIKYG